MNQVLVKDLKVGDRIIRNAREVAVTLITVIPDTRGNCYLAFSDGGFSHAGPDCAYPVAGSPGFHRKWVDGCDYCMKQADPSGFFPDHDASPRCQSGKHPHCTCDTCF